MANIVTKIFLNTVLAFLISSTSTNVLAASSCDTNRDTYISPIDVLVIINFLNNPTIPSKYSLDVNLDGNIGPIDALIIINYLNAGSSGPCGKEIDESLRIGSPEDYSMAPSTPPLSPSQSPSSSPSPSPSPSPSSSPSPSPSPECPDSSQSKDACGICGGSGPDACGNCGVGPFPPGKTPNVCGQCGNVGINECGSCTGFPNEIVKGCDGVCGSNKTNSGCDNTCGSTRSFDKCGLCGGDGSGCDCVWASGWADYSNVSDFYGDGAGGYHELKDIYGTLQNRLEPPTKKLPACFEEIANAAFCRNTLEVNTSVRYWGACNYPATEEERQRRLALDAQCKVAPSIRCLLSSTLFGSPGDGGFMEQIKAFASLLGVPNDKLMEFQIPPVKPGGAPAVWWFVDDNCKYKPTSANTKVCGFAGYSWSPISLMLEDEVGLESDMRVVEFSLAPGTANTHTLWKGSAEAPLLVYDPEDLYTVASATQLFGNYAFGGKTDSLSEYRKIKEEPWQNGYQALALLDENKDLKISGEELNNLKLWFDHNKNAISEQGEIRKLSENGITAIYYKNPTTTENQKDIHMSIGFEMLKDGKKVVRPSVDWFTESFASKNEAVIALHSKFRAKRASLESEKNASSDAIHKDTSNIKIDENDPISKNISGYWTWTLTEKGNTLAPGFFVFGQDSKSGAVTARSIVETNLDKNPQNLRSAMASIPGEGHVSSDTEGKVKLNISFVDSQSGGSATTTATLSSDGMTLYGRTTQNYELKEGSEVKKAKVDYQWIATRINFK